MLHHTLLVGATGISGHCQPWRASTVSAAFAGRVTEVPYPAVKCRQLCPSAVTGLVSLGWAGDGVAAKPVTASAKKAEVIPSPSGVGICIAAPRGWVETPALPCSLLGLALWVQEGPRHAEGLPSANLLFLLSFAACQKEAKGSWRQGVGAIKLVPACAAGAVCEGIAGGHHPALLRRGWPRSPFSLR